MVSPVAGKTWSGYKKNLPKKSKHFGPAEKLGVKDEMLLCLIIVTRNR